MTKQSKLNQYCKIAGRLCEEENSKLNNWTHVLLQTLVQDVSLAQEQQQKSQPLTSMSLKSWGRGTMCKMMNEALLSESRDMFAQAKSSLLLAHLDHIKKGGCLSPNM